MEKACDGGDMVACTSLGNLYYNGQGAIKNFTQARPSYQKACDGGNLSGFASLGTVYDNGQGVTKDYAQALKFYQKACVGGVTNVCNSLGWLYDSGHGAPRNYAQARAFYEKACDSGDMGGCNNLGSCTIRAMAFPRIVHRRGPFGQGPATEAYRTPARACDEQNEPRRVLILASRGIDVASGS